MPPVEFSVTFKPSAVVIEMPVVNKLAKNWAKSLSS
nr:MAG TPA: hypothetical protein [Caudoviricetes sp.]